MFETWHIKYTEHFFWLWLPGYSLALCYFSLAILYRVSPFIWLKNVSVSSSSTSVCLCLFLRSHYIVDWLIFVLWPSLFHQETTWSQVQNNWEVKWKEIIRGGNQADVWWIILILEWGNIMTRSKCSQGKLIINSNNQNNGEGSCGPKGRDQ